MHNIASYQSRIIAPCGRLSEKHSSTFSDAQSSLSHQLPAFLHQASVPVTFSCFRTRTSTSGSAPPKPTHFIKDTVSKIDSPICSYSSMTKYISLKKPFLPSDPLFIDSSRTIISRHWFSSHLTTLVSRAGLLLQSYTPQSF
ncbi:UNVERIFIED_CONTAM: hypothetical protein FKN15_014671 [Acipenser sinensis]